MSSADITRRELTLGDRDSTTGWCSKTFVSTTIKGLLEGEDGNWMALGAGTYSPHSGKFDTPDVIHEADEIEAPVGTQNYYVVKSVRPIYWCDQFDRNRCTIEKRQFANHPAFYNFGDPTVDDSRMRTKVYLDNTIDPGDNKLTWDDGLTLANWVVAWDGIPYPIIREFTEKSVDLLFVVKPSNVTMHKGYPNDVTYAYTEQVPITIWVADKVNYLTGENLKNKAEQELRRVVETNADGVGSVRFLSAGKPVNTSIFSLYSYEYMLTYMRASVTYTSGVTCTYANNQFYTYNFPNVLDVQFRDADTGDIHLFPPGRIGNITQILGMEDFEIIITCDLTIGSNTYTWKRPQTSLPKTDSVDYQVFMEMKFDHKYSATAVYQNLNWGGGATVPVRLVEWTATDNRLTLTFRRYSATAGTAYKTWYGLG